MSQSKTEITVRHTVSNAIRDTISRVIRTKNVNGEPTEVVMYNGNWFRVVRRGRGVFFYKNRPIKELSASAAA